MSPLPDSQSRQEAVAPQCPVCQARFRGSVVCPRCGSDLGLFMGIVARAWALRQRCRKALQAGDLRSALRLAIAARKLKK